MAVPVVWREGLPPSRAKLAEVSDLVRAAAAALDAGDRASAQEALDALEAVAQQTFDPDDPASTWRTDDAEDVARRLLHPPPEALPPLDREEMIEVMSLILDPVADPIEVERWSQGLIHVTGDADFADLVSNMAPGPTPEQIIDWAVARGRGEPVPLVRDATGMWRPRGNRGPLADVPLLTWLKDRKAQREDAPGIPATMARLAKELDDDADPDEIIDHLRPKLPYQAMLLLEARIAVWSADQE